MAEEKKPEAVESQPVTPDGKWGWIFLIILTLCITGYQVLELYLEHS